MDRKAAGNAVLYCDMDGVLCDFFSAASAVAGKPPGALKVSELWRHVRRVDDFWESLDILPDANRLWSLLNRHGAHILSSVAVSDPNCAPGKLRWLERNLRMTDHARIHLPVRRNKRLFATFDGSANILIDDYEKNIWEWEQSGGIGILHRSAAESISTLDDLGFR